MAIRNSLDIHARTRIEIEKYTERLSAFIANVLKQNTSIMATIYDLPQELWGEILQHLSLKDVYALMEASNEFKYRVQQTYIWKSIRKAMLEEAPIYKKHIRRTHNRKIIAITTRSKTQQWQRSRRPKSKSEVKSVDLPDCLFHCFERCI